MHPVMRRTLYPLLLTGAGLLASSCAGIEPLDPQAAPGEEGAACAADGCDAGLSCVAGTCVQPCLAAVDCQGRSCLPLPGGSGGWCAPPGMGGEPPPPQAPGGSEPGESHPDEPIPAPAPDGADPAPGGTPDALPPKVPDGPADTPPADEPPPSAPPAAPPAEEQAPPSAPPAEQAPPPCRYPTGPHALQNGAVVPNLAWRGAYDARGQRVDFDLEAFHCDPAYDRYSILAVVVGAEWCGACAEYLQQSAGQMAAADRAGALYLFIEVQDNNYSPASHEVARRTIERHAPGAPGLRVGDGATSPAGAVGNAPIVQQFPTIFAVRRSDMRLIPSLGGYLDFANLARQEADQAPPPADPGGGVGPAPDVGPAPGGCAEEDLEPNDGAGAAPTVVPGQQVIGGICNGSDDFFRVEHDGFWTVDLRFSHAEGDLDLYLWDAARGGPAIGLDGQPVGSASASDDETLVFLGPQTIQITGYQGARASYVMTVIGH